MVDSNFLTLVIPLLPLRQYKLWVVPEVCPLIGIVFNHEQLAPQLVKEGCSIDNLGSFSSMMGHDINPPMHPRILRVQSAHSHLRPHVGNPLENERYHHSSIVELLNFPLLTLVQLVLHTHQHLFTLVEYCRLHGLQGIQWKSMNGIIDREHKRNVM